MRQEIDIWKQDLESDELISQSASRWDRRANYTRKSNELGKFRAKTRHAVTFLYCYRQEVFTDMILKAVRS